VGATVFVALVLFLFPFPANATHCENVASSASGWLFDSYEVAEYSPDGWLIVHLKLLGPYNDGRGWNFFASIWDDECDIATRTTYKSGMSIPAGIKFWSIRFTSNTQYEIWDDENEVFVASLEINPYPGYFEVAFRGSTYETFNGSQFTTTSYRIRNDAADPPIQSETLDPPEVCANRTFKATGYFFDEYEYVEYTDELLHVYLRLKSPYNDGRGWWKSGIFFFDENCNFVGGTSDGGGSLEPYSHYYSLHFTNPTNYEIWNDELGTLRKSVDLSGKIPPTAVFATYWASIDGDASRLETTPFPIAESDYISEPDPVIFIPGILGSWEKNGELVIDPVLHTFDNIIETFKLNGYIEDETLFTFPYNWRESNVLTAGLLRNKINEVQEICECDKIDIVAHSMGGLVARYYIQSGLYENDVDQLIFLGTPHLGAPKSYLTWEGAQLDDEFDTSVLEYLLRIEARKNNFDSTFDYIRNKPVISVNQLLPTFNYLRDKDTGILRNYPISYPQNTFLENLNANISNLFDSSVNITNIVGNIGSGTTITALRVIESQDLPKWEYGYPDGFDDIDGDHGIEKKIGDGTVPSISAKFIDIDLHELASSHIDLVKDTQSLVFQKLAGRLPEQISDVDFGISRGVLLINVLSPIDIMITTPNGDAIGKNFETGEEINEIEGAFYSGFETDNEYITIPDPVNGEYSVVTQGTGDGGEYTIAVGYITGTDSIKTSITSTILPETFEKIKLSIDKTNPENTYSEDTSEISLEILIEHIEKAFELGWIANEDYKINLQNIVRSSINSEETNIESMIKIFQKRLYNGYYKDEFINETGYNLLKEDIFNLYLLN